MNKSSSPRFWWAMHNIIAHPLYEITSWFGLDRLSNWIHDSTLPNETHETLVTSDFERQARYVVLKRSALVGLTPEQQVQLIEITKSHDAHRLSMDKSALNTVVVESDWPEYEPTWAAIKDRSNK